MIHWILPASNTRSQGQLVKNKGLFWNLTALILQVCPQISDCFKSSSHYLWILVRGLCSKPDHREIYHEHSDNECSLPFSMSSGTPFWENCICYKAGSWTQELMYLWHNQYLSQLYALSLFRNDSSFHLLIWTLLPFLPIREDRPRTMNNQAVHGLRHPNDKIELIEILGAEEWILPDS